MSRTLSPPSRGRAALVAAVLGLLSLTGCSSGDDSSEAGGGSSTGSDTKRVSAVGVSFEVPAGWQELEAKEVAEGAGENSKIGELADQMGLTPEQFEQTMASVDLMVVSDEGARAGFLDNVTVLQAAGHVPNDEQLKLQFLQIGADVHDISHERTELGDTTLLVYELEAADLHVQGEAVFVETDEGAVSLTVSATERDTADEIAGGIVDSLAKTS
jgi:hypothetical protein